MEVITALSKVMGELPAIGKDAKSPEGYSYRGIEAITKHLQPLLAKHGVIIVPNASITSVVASPEMKPGWQDVYATVEWTIYGPDGSSITARTNGVGRDKADKGANKAQTQAFKYLLLHLLSIADKADDSDGLTYEHERRTGPTEAARTLYDAVAALAGTETAAAIKADAKPTGRSSPPQRLMRIPTGSRWSKHTSRPHA
jgi:hypothetical protein